MANDNSKAIVRVNVEETTAKIEKVLDKCNAQALAKMPPMTQAVELARGVHALRREMSQEFVSKVFMPLQGSPLGFVTDRDNAKEGPREYPWEVVRDCMIEGMIKGLRPVNNEINIIAGRAYAAKNGVTRLVAEMQGLTDLRVKFAAPNVKDGEARVQAVASWKWDGKPMKLERIYEKQADGSLFDGRISVRVNRAMGTDAILGKAKRKLFYEIHEIVTGTKFTGGLGIDQGEGDETVVDADFEVVSEPAEPMPETKQGQRVKLPGDRPIEPPKTQKAKPTAQQGTPPWREPGNESEQDDIPPEPTKAAQTPKDSKQQGSSKSIGKPARKRRRTQPTEETVKYDPETGEVDEGEPAEQDESLFNK